MKRLTLIFLFSLFAFAGWGQKVVMNEGKVIRVDGKVIIQSYEIESSRIFAAMGTYPDKTRRRLIDNLVRGMKEDGEWSMLDFLHMYAAHAENSSLLNWINPGTFDATNISSTAFEINKGYTGDGVADYLNSNYNPLTQGVNYTQNDASFGVYINTNVTEDKFDFGYKIGAQFICLLSGYSGDKAYYRINDAVADYVVSTDSRGFWIASRTASNVKKLYKDKILVAEDVATSAPRQNQEVYTLCYNNGGSAASFSTKQVAVDFMGAGLTQTNVNNITDRINTYLEGIEAEMAEVINIKDSGASESETPENNYTYIQQTIDSEADSIVFGLAGESYTISQPLLFQSNKSYVFDAEIKIKDGTETLLTSDTSIGDALYSVADASDFNIGEYVGIWDDNSATGYDQKRATTGEIIDITGNNITIANTSNDGYEVSENATLGNIQNCVIMYRKENINIYGSGIINNNAANQSYIHPIWNDPVNEYQLAGCGMTIYDCDNVTINGDITFKNGCMHNLAITGQGSGGYKNTDITVKGITAQDVHEKNILVRFVTGGLFEDLTLKDALYEDGIIFYSGCVNIEANNINSENCGRGNFFWNSESNNNLIANNITTSGTGYGIYISAKNATISNITCSNPMLISRGYTVSDIVINNATFTGVVYDFVIRLTGAVDGITINNAVITGCTGIGIKTDDLVGGSLPIDVVFNDGGIYDHAGDKTSIQGGTDITFNNFEGLWMWLILLLIPNIRRKEEEFKIAA